MGCENCGFPVTHPYDDAPDGTILHLADHAGVYQRSSTAWNRLWDAPMDRSGQIWIAKTRSGRRWLVAYPSFHGWVLRPLGLDVGRGGGVRDIVIPETRLSDPKKWGRCS